MPFNQWPAIVPSDTVDLPKLTHAVWVGGAGNVAAVMQDDTVGVFTGVTAGATLPIACKRVNATNTTATNLRALYQI